MHLVNLLLKHLMGKIKKWVHLLKQLNNFYFHIPHHFGRIKTLQKQTSNETDAKLGQYGERLQRERSRNKESSASQGQHDGVISLNY